MAIVSGGGFSGKEMEPVSARRTEISVQFNGVDITEDMQPFLISLTYTDSVDDESDDLSIELQDRSGWWLEQWLEGYISAAAASSLKISADICRKNWTKPGDDLRLPTGEFVLDSVKYDAAGGTLTISATAMSFNTKLRQTKRSKKWEKYNLSGIAQEIASNSGLSCMLEISNNPYYDEKQQTEETDIGFLSSLCKDAGVSLKVTDGGIVLFDLSSYENKEPVLTLKQGRERMVTQWIDCTLSTSTAETQYDSCRVRYTDPATGKLISGVEKWETYVEPKEDSDGNLVADTDNQQLEIWAKVSSAEEAKALAGKQLQLHNKFARTAEITVPGNPALVAGMTVQLEEFGAFDGKYYIKQAEHSIDGSGYTTRMSLYRVVS